MAPFIRQAFARLRPIRVQPFKAAPPSGGGRGPEASRERMTSPRAGAASRPIFGVSSGQTPLGGRDGGTICWTETWVKRLGINILTALRGKRNAGRSGKFARIALYSIRVRLARSLRPACATLLRRRSG